MENFGIRLKNLREKKGLSIEDLSNNLNINKCLLQDWEKGERCLRISQLIKVAIYFDVSIDYLVGL